MCFGSFSSFTRVMRDGVRCEVAATAEEKRMFVVVVVLKLLVLRRRRRERNDIVFGDWMVLSLVGAFNVSRGFRRNNGFGT